MWASECQQWEKELWVGVTVNLVLGERRACTCICVRGLIASKWRDLGAVFICLVHVILCERVFLCNSLAKSKVD